MLASSWRRGKSENELKREVKEKKMLLTVFVFVAKQTALNGDC